jgi:hypothetical protein
MAKPAPAMPAIWADIQQARVSPSAPEKQSGHVFQQLLAKATE